MPAVWTIGHGTRPIEEFVAVLSQASLAKALESAGIEYVHLPGLGGRREPRVDSPHRALRVAAFRGYADHMASEEFAADFRRNWAFPVLA